jgi:hypothetical protein
MKPEIKFSHLISAIAFLLVCGFIGGFVLLGFTYPTIWPRWLLYVFVIFIGSGFGLPISYLFNRFLSAHKLLTRERLLRESIGTGIYFAFLVWLSIGRMLTFSLALLFGIALLFIEYLLRMREINNETDPESEMKNESKRSSIR